jgi:hypothetical protein
MGSLDAAVRVQDVAVMETNTVCASFRISLNLFAD